MAERANTAAMRRDKAEAMDQNAARGHHKGLYDPAKGEILLMTVSTVVLMLAAILGI